MIGDIVIVALAVVAILGAAMFALAWIVALLLDEVIKAFKKLSF